MRIAIWIAGLALAAVVLAACAGGDGNTANTGRPARPGKVTASCQAVNDIQRYRYYMSLKLQSPAFQESIQATPGHPLSAYGDTLNRLFSDYQLEGAFVAPDRSLAVFRFQQDELELRAIGDESWLRKGATWLKEESPPNRGDLLTLEVVCEEIVKDIAPSLSEVQPQQETVNGIESDHYRLNEADLNSLLKLLGIGPELGLPQRFQVDVWIAREDRWPVRLQVVASDTDEKGQPIGLEWFLDFRDINDPTIEIEPPAVPPVGT